MYRIPLYCYLMHLNDRGCSNIPPYLTGTKTNRKKNFLPENRKYLQVEMPFFPIILNQYVKIPCNLGLNRKLNYIHTCEVKQIARITRITCTCARSYCIITIHVCTTRVAGALINILHFRRGNEYFYEEETNTFTRKVVHSLSSFLTTMQICCIIYDCRIRSSVHTCAVKSIARIASITCTHISPYCIITSCVRMARVSHAFIDI